jgi:hypothetical protein
MIKHINKIRGIRMKYILMLVIVISNIAKAQQVCRTESQIPHSTPDNIYIDNANNTITDKRFGLMWQKCELGLSGDNCEIGVPQLYTWGEALVQASSNNLSGYSDWRLPNKNELLSIVEYACYEPSINTTYFPNTSPSFFWTESPFPLFSNRSWTIHFIAGDSDGRSGREVNEHNVRLVRTIL